VTQLLTDDLMTLAAAARLVPPARGGATAPSTIWRWATHGVRGPDGIIVKLRTTRIGGRPMVSREALEEFLANLNAPASSPPAPRADKHTAGAERELDRLRIG
jgi:hypothetical protein